MFGPLLALEGVFLGAAGVLGSQLIAARASLKAKRLDVLFARKADAYSTFLSSACRFAADPKSYEMFYAFQSALHSALIVASEPVANLLDLVPSRSIHVQAVLLRTAEDDGAAEAIRVTGWFDAMKRLVSEMRVDLKGF